MDKEQLLSTKNQNVSSSNTNIINYSEEKRIKLKKYIFNFIQQNNVDIINDDQINYEGKHQTILSFSEKIKWIFEKVNKNFPILTIDEYIQIILELNADSHRAQQLSSTNLNSKFLNEAEILSLVKTEKLDYSKSIVQAEEFLKHILFKIPDHKGYVKVIAKKYHTVIDINGNNKQIEQEILLPGYKHISEYEDTLKNIPVRASVHEKPQTYWDVFSKSKSVMFATMTYHPYKELYWIDEFKHYYINTYKEPAWKEQPEYHYMMIEHKKKPQTFDDLSDVLRSFLIHLFPDSRVRNEVLKWCAFSNTDKLQTYLTLIGAPGIGKTLFVEDFLGYYHGEENLNFPKCIETKFNDGFSKSTLLYFDEKMMTTLEQYNEMKSYINKKLAYEEKNRPIYMADNFANVVWSCNTKDTMTGMNRDDRRFKIVAVTNEKLIGAPIYAKNGHIVDHFTSNIIKNFIDTDKYKKEFVALMFSIIDFVSERKISKNDINTISDNNARDAIFSASRSIEFIEIMDIFRNIYNDYNEETGLFNKKMTSEEKELMGTPYQDFIPLSKIRLPDNPYYSYRVPFAIVRHVIATKGNNSSKNTMSYRNFQKHLDNMPPKMVRGIRGGVMSGDIEIKVDGEGIDSPAYFNEYLLPILKKKFTWAVTLRKSKHFNKIPTQKKDSDLNQTEENNDFDQNDMSLKDDIPLVTDKDRQR